MQAWLAAHNILMGRESRAKALASGMRCDAALRLRPLLTDTLMDQLPVLRDLHRVLDELMLGYTGAAERPLGGCLLLEQVCLLPCLSCFRVPEALQAFVKVRADKNIPWPAPRQGPYDQCTMQVPMLREAIVKGADWEATAQAQKEGAFGAHAAEHVGIRRRTLLSSLEALWAMETDQDTMQVGAITGHFSLASSHSHAHPPVGQGLNH